MRRPAFDAILVVGAVAILIAGAAGSAAGPGVTGVSQHTGTAYDMVYTCAASTATTRFRVVPNGPAIRFDTTLAGSGASTQVSTTTYQSNVGTGVWATLAASFTATAMAFSEGFDSEATLSPLLNTPVSCPDYSVATPTLFDALPGGRSLDTRSETAVAYSGPKPGLASTITVTMLGTQGIPTTATAVALNVTITDATAPGFVQVFPTGQATPGSSSSVNVHHVGQTIANTVIVPVGDGGKISFFTSSGAHILADVVGSFSPAAGAAAAAGRLIARSQLDAERRASRPDRSQRRGGADGRHAECRRPAPLRDCRVHIGGRPGRC